GRQIRCPARRTSCPARRTSCPARQIWCPGRPAPAPASAAPPPPASASASAAAAAAATAAAASATGAARSRCCRGGAAARLIAGAAACLGLSRAQRSARPPLTPGVSTTPVQRDALHLLWVTDRQAVEAGSLLGSLQGACSALSGYRAPSGGGGIRTPGSF